MASMSDPDLGVSKAMAMYGWCCAGTWSGDMRVHAVLCTERMVPLGQRFLCLLYKEELWTSLKCSRDCRQMDLMWRCFVSVNAIVWGSGKSVTMVCRSMMDVCIPRVLRVSA